MTDAQIIKGLSLVVSGTGDRLSQLNAILAASETILRQSMPPAQRSEVQQFVEFIKSEIKFLNEIKESLNAIIQAA